jgi:putative SOS response-associated peptidase YedK
VEEDHDGQAALRDRTGQSPADGHGGVVETWRSPAGERIRSFTIITTTPNELCAELHNRMPVVLKPETWPVWLGEQPADVPQLKALLPRAPSDEMICWPVIIRAGNVKKQRPEPHRADRRLRCNFAQ